MSKKYGKKCPWKNSNRWKKRRETPKRNPFWQLWSVDKARSMQNLVHFSEDQKHCVMACVFEKWLCLPTAKDSNQFFDHMKYFQRELAPCCSFRPFLNVFKHTVFFQFVPAGTILHRHFYDHFYLVKFGYNSRFGYYSRAGTNWKITVFPLKLQIHINGDVWLKLWDLVFLLQIHRQIWVLTKVQSFCSCGTVCNNIERSSAL